MPAGKKVNSRGAAPAINSEPQFEGLDVDMGFSCTDLGNAERLDYRYGLIFRYSWQRSKWLIWNGKHWYFTDGSKISFFAQNTVRDILKEAAAAIDHDRRADLAKHAISSESAHRIDAMVNLARSVNPLTSVTVDQLDQNPLFLNVRNGTIELANKAKLKPHDKRDMITIMIDLDYDPKAKSEAWEDFLDTVFEGNTEVIEYLQRALGYSITGSQEEQAFFFNYGTGWNGKTTLLGAIQDVLGPYATEVDPLAFMVDKHAKAGPNEALASLHGKNFVCSTEVEDGQRLSVSLVKRMTGGEQIRCERKYEHGFNFKPTHKLWLSGNHEPIITDTTSSIWLRLKKIKYPACVPEDKRVKDLRHILAKDHGQAILTWLVDGCLKWKETGLMEPIEIRQAVLEYRQRSDALHDYLAESCLVKPGEVITVSELYKAFKVWCEANDMFHPIGKILFNARMREKGYTDRPGNGNKPTWHGIRLLTDDEKVNLVNSNSSFTETSLRAGVKKSSGKIVNGINRINTFPNKPCAQCGTDEPEIDPEHGAYRCSKCERYYSVSEMTEE